MTTRVHAICLVKNEGDVIAEILQLASKFCHKIYVFDTGSTDNSWEEVQRVASDVIIPFRHENVLKFDFGLRGQVFNAVRDTFEIGDWLYVLDADEVLAESPHKAIRIAEAEGAQQINTLQYNFHFTELDWQQYQAGLDSRDRPISERRHYYCFTNIEQRLFRIEADTTWPEYTDAENPIGYLRPKATKKLKKGSYRIANCHYQYRDPEQIKLRLVTRQEARKVNQNNFIHYQSVDTDLNWERYIVPSEQLYYYNNDGVFKIRLSEQINLLRWRSQDVLSKMQRRLALSIK
jgi:glycosyltransferase involved in cell wall biosynthesis